MLTLADLKEGQEAEIDRVYEEDEKLLQFFDEEGFRPGMRVAVEEVATYRGTITVRIGERRVVLGTPVANKVWVTIPGRATASAESRR
jgi:DtxR family Mn-dependent transcriptional regulator